ncbi:hypothetical protein PLEOSDRAFT_1108223 [Pleurotus ostreatus PC15]|uniref:Uncharacterized protein n=1 Tax=Pleurotus ostreatus (strain PC15) TaxID=1137138 RepID=A0A067N6T6_PLEO1|nr:hypothetical protein PLEOSDRAFT_1108223 [Pleurotus ostreatus PC15]
MSVVVNDILDDRDTRIRYSPGWVAAGATNEYNGTTTYCSKEGAEFSFKFFGTSMKVFGTLGPAGHQGHSNTTNVVAHYVLDGGKPEPPEPPKPDKLTSGPRYQQLFYSSPFLSLTDHTLVGICGSKDSGQVFLDYFVVETPIDLPQNYRPRPTQTSTTSVQASETVAPGRATSYSPPSNPPTALIVGSVAGGFALIFIIGVFYLWLRRHSSPSKGPISYSKRLPYLPYLPGPKSMSPRSKEPATPLSSIPLAYDGRRKSIMSQYATSPTFVQRSASPESGCSGCGGHLSHQGY